MEVVLGHWDSWEDGALIIDKKSGRFADPTKVKRLDHDGQFFKSRGPFTVPRSPQGHPVVIQAGASGRGQRFAGRWGEVIFTAARNLPSAKQGYDAIRNEAAKAGRDPDQMFLCNLTTPVCGATKSEAEDKMALIEKLPLEIDALSLLAEGLNFDFGAKGIDEPLTTEELQGMQGMLGIRDGVLKTSGKTNPSTRDFITFSGRGQTADAIVGGPKEIADIWKRCSSAAAATALSSRRPMCPAPTPISSATSCPNCSAAACSTRITPARRCARIWACGARPPAPGKPGRKPPPNKKAKHMRWLKFTAAGQTSWGIVEGDRVIAVSGDPFGEWQRTAQSHALKDVKIELPLIPRTFYCVGLNYLKHLKEAADKAGTVPNVPDRPEIGYRAQNALIAHDEDVVIPATATEKIHYEGELVVVIGKKAKHLDRDRTRCPACSATPSATTSASAPGRRPTAACGAPRMPIPSSRWGRGSRPTSISTRWKP